MHQHKHANRVANTSKEHKHKQAQPYTDISKQTQTNAGKHKQIDKQTNKQTNHQTNKETTQTNE